jgi:uncharacterized membrane protein YqhA
MWDLLLLVALGLYVLLSLLCYAFFARLWWVRRNMTDAQLFEYDDYYRELN